MVPLLFLLSFKKNEFLRLILKYLLIFNIITFNSILFFQDSFNYSVHLPLHLCYFTEICLLISFVLKIKRLYPWLILNGMFGGIVGFVTTNLTSTSMLIEYVHFYLSHFNLLLFTVICYKSNIMISIADFFKSIYLNSLIIILIVMFNIKFKTNYWFTELKPGGVNLSALFPDWPYYFFILIALGLVSYMLTFFIFSYRDRQRGQFNTI